MDNVPLTPMPQPEQRTMDFPNAIAEIIKGNKVARKEWNNTDYGFLSAEGWLSIQRNGQFFVWKVNDGDLLATDWILV